MTPEYARELLNAIPIDGFSAPETRVTPALVAAAPALAGVVAELSYEYAVQIPVASDGPESPWWKYLMYTPTGRAKTTTLPRVARWFPAELSAVEYAEEAVGDQFRIVRRLVSWTEVVS